MTKTAFCGFALPIWEFLFLCCERPKGEEIGIFQSLLFYFEKWCCVKCGLVNHLPVKDLWKAIRVFEVIHLFGEITAFETIWIISCLAAIYPHANYPIYQNPRTQTIYKHQKIEPFLKVKKYAKIGMRNWNCCSRLKIKKLARVIRKYFNWRFWYLNYVLETGNWKLI